MCTCVCVCVCVYTGAAKSLASERRAEIQRVKKRVRQHARDALLAIQAQVCLTHTHTYPPPHTHTHTYTERERDGTKMNMKANVCMAYSCLTLCVCVCVCVCVSPTQAHYLRTRERVLFHSHTPARRPHTSITQSLTQGSVCESVRSQGNMCENRDEWGTPRLEAPVIPGGLVKHAERLGLQVCVDTHTHTHTHRHTHTHTHTHTYLYKTHVGRACMLHSVRAFVVCL